ncbi:MAG TPA: ABC transporter substrate-binding protein [Acetobacteraceae bacterium]|nr:ABC transporter substrate-binding protein [Acetobacteraceae bacterium]
MTGWKRILGGSIIALGLCEPGWAQDIKLGVLTDLGGPYADSSGQGAVEATKMAVEDLQAQLGKRRVEVVSADHQSKPDVGAAIARRWLDTEGVDAVVNVPNSAIALAVQTVTRERKRIFLITGGATAELTGRQCSPYSAHWTDDTYSLSTGTTRAVMERGGADTWFLVTADYAAGYGLASAARKVIEGMGGKVVGEAKHPFGATDQSAFLLQAQSSGAKMIALANAGTDTILSVKQAHEFHVGPPAQTLVAMALFITDVHSLGLETAQGLLFDAGFYWDRNDASRAWSRRFFERIGRMPTREQAETYSAVYHYLRAVIAVGSKEAEPVMAWMKGNPLDDFYAPGARIRADGRLIHPIYLFQVKSPAESKYPWDYYKLIAEISPEHAFRPLEEGACPFVQQGAAKP